jgi:hypothetical protein
MGLDFIRRCAPTFTKAWKHGRNELATPTLFTRAPGARARSVVALSNGTNPVTSGSQVIVASDGNGLVMLKGTHRIATVPTAPADVLRDIKEAGGVTVGTIGTLHPLSGSFDVELP